MRVKKLVTDLLPDKLFLSLYYRKVFGRPINWKHPVTFNEKLQYLKLFDRRPEYRKYVDKYEVKEFFREKIGGAYIVPTYGVWDRFDDIPFDRLPNQFVLKCTHDSGGIVICKDKKSFDRAAAKEKLEHSLKVDFYKWTREWPYKGIKRRILAEAYLEDKTYGELRDYKFFCFNGEPKVMFIASGRNTDDPRFDFYDMDFNHLSLTKHYPNADTLPERPINFDKMKKFARILSCGIPHVRVDFFEADGNLYAGEMTFYSQGGFGKFDDPAWDKKMGDYLCLPKQKH